MTRTTTDPATVPAAGRTAAGSRLYDVLIGLCALAVLLQGLWAGIFLEHDGRRDAASGWLDVHARGGEIALALALLLALESWLGGAIRDDGRDTLTAVHVPLAMAIMALVVWLPLRARRVRRVSP
jgi:hypothetical protein